MHSRAIALPLYCLFMSVSGPGKQPPSARAWKDKDSSSQKWQALPEWASDDSVTSSSVGTFDSSGNFTSPLNKVCVWVLINIHYY